MFALKFPPPPPQKNIKFTKLNFFLYDLNITKAVFLLLFFFRLWSFYSKEVNKKRWIFDDLVFYDIELKTKD